MRILFSFKVIQNSISTEIRRRERHFLNESRVIMLIQAYIFLFSLLPVNEQHILRNELLQCSHKHLSHVAARLTLYIPGDYDNEPTLAARREFPVRLSHSGVSTGEAALRCAHTPVVSRFPFSLLPSLSHALVPARAGWPCSVQHMRVSGTSNSEGN